MNKLILFFNSLDRRERLILLIGLYSLVIIIGVFGLLLPILDKKKEVEKRINKEFQNYYELVKLTEKYLSFKKQFLPTEKLSLDFISKISKKANLKPYSLKKIDEGKFEILFENTSGNQFTRFLKLLNENNLSVEEIDIYIEKGNIKRGKIIISNSQL
ncbi:MAG: hypothetical protein DSY59_05870 [Persephonella sp.]|nr:MAG: hypothetical protein DSY59_05870 [Persephonella sp.]